MSDAGSSSSELSELQDGVGLRSELGSSDSAADSEPETEAETERLDPTPHKARDGNFTLVGATAEPNEAVTPKIELQVDKSRPGLTAQDILGDERISSDAEDAEDEHDIAMGTAQAQVKLASELAGKKRKRSGSIPTIANGKSSEGGPLKKRSSSTRFDRKAGDATKQALGIMREHHEEAIVSSADEGKGPNDVIDDETPRLVPHINASDNHGDPVGHVDLESNKDELGELSDGLGDDDRQPNEAVEEEDAEVDGGRGEREGDEDEAEPGAETTAKSEDERAQDLLHCVRDSDLTDMLEVSKKKVAMDALIPIEKLFAIFRDRLFEERWGQLSAEHDVLIAPNTTHPEYLAMLVAVNARREEKLHLEDVALEYKMKDLETRILAKRAQIHAQYFQTVRNIREECLEKLNEQFSRIQRERRQWKTKEPHFVYTYDPKRSKQVVYQTAYNQEVSILSGIAKNVGFPAAPEIHGATSNDVEEDLRAMKIKPQAQQISYTSRIASSARADEAAADAAAEEQFLEKTPWANPQHPAHQQVLVTDPNNHEPTRSLTATPTNGVPDIQRDADGSTIAIAENSDPHMALAQSQENPMINGSFGFEQMKRDDLANVDQEHQSKDDETNSSDLVTNPAAFTYGAIPASTSYAAAENGYYERPDNVYAEASTVQQSFTTPTVHPDHTSEIYVSGPTYAPQPNPAFGSPGPEEQYSRELEEHEASTREQERYRSPALDAAAYSGAAEERFTPTPPPIEGIKVEWV